MGEKDKGKKIVIVVVVVGGGGGGKVENIYISKGEMIVVVW